MKKKHITALFTKLSSSIYIICSISPILNKHTTTLSLYNAILFLHCKYGFTHRKSDLVITYLCNNILSLQKNVIKIMINSLIRSSCRTLFYMLNLLTVSHTYTYLRGLRFYQTQFIQTQQIIGCTWTLTKVFISVFLSTINSLLRLEM